MNEKLINELNELKELLQGMVRLIDDLTSLEEPSKAQLDMYFCILKMQILFVKNIDNQNEKNETFVKGGLVPIKKSDLLFPKSLLDNIKPME